MAAKSAMPPVPMPPVRGVHHFAYKCKDAAATRRFYEDVLGMPLVHVIEEHDVKTTTGDVVSFAHFFFKMADGNYLAFFDLADGRAAERDPKTPQFVNHLALGVANEAELLACKTRLEAAGVEVIGPLDHDGFVRSIYFWDPNGVRLEFTYTIADAAALAKDHAQAGARLDDWLRRTARGKATLAAAE